MTATNMQKAATAVAATFALVGVLGFIPGVTADYDQMEFAGHESGAMLLAIFQVSVLHNIVHLLFGAVGLVLARSWAGARGFLIGGGATYLVLWAYGLVVSDREGANFVPLNNADDWLHLALGLAMVGIGLALSKERGARTRTV
jgi:hypothetical protein